MRKSIRLRFVGSLVMIVLIPIVVLGIFFYLYNIYDGEDKIAQERLASFQQAVTQSNYLFREISSIALHMSGNMAKLVTADGPTDVAGNDYEIMQQLSSYQNSLSIHVRMLFYLRGRSDIYADDEIIDYSVFEASLESKSDADLAMSTFFRRLNTISSARTYRLNYNFLDRSQNGGLVAGIHPLPVMDPRPLADVVFLINEQDLVNIFENTMGSFRGNILAYNMSAEYVFANTSDPNRDPSILLEDIYKIKGTGILRVAIHGQKMVCMRGVAEDNGVTYVVIMEEKEFFRELNSARIILSLLLMVLLILCIFFAVMIGYFNYKPIKALIADIAGGELEELGNNELEIIKSAFQKSWEQNERLTLQLDSQYQIIRSQFLLRLVRGKLKTQEEYAYHAALANMRLDRGCCFAAVFSIYSAANRQAVINCLLERSALISLEQCDLYYTELLSEEQVVYIINGPECLLTDEKVRTQTAQALHAAINQENDACLLFGVGSAYQSPLQASLSYIEAMAALQNVLPDGKNNIYYYSRALSETGMHNIPVMGQSLLIESIRLGNRSAAEEALNAIMLELQNSGQSFLFTQLNCYDILNLIIKLLSQHGIMLCEKKISRASSFDTLAEFHVNLKELIHDSCMEIEKKQERHDSSLKIKVLDYINRNYTSVDFSLERVAEAAGITKPRVSTILKNEIGYSFGQYVTVLRMDEAKRQLRQTNKKVQNIVNDVGYLDVPNFLRKFKNIEGMTPGQYRELYKEHFG